MIRLQRCADCGAVQYPPREFCGACLSDRLAWEGAASLPGRVLARTRLHHSNEPHFRARLPLDVGLVRLDAGPVVVCFVTDASDAVRVSAGEDGLLITSPAPRAGEVEVRSTEGEGDRVGTLPVTGRPE